MHRTFFMLAAVVAVMQATLASAADIMVGDLKITAPWARATPKGAKVGGGYMTITNTGASADRLVGGASDISEKFELHEMSMSGGVMKMRPVSAGLEIKPGQTIELKPGGLHIMFKGLKKPLTMGDTVKVTLSFEKAGKVEVSFPVAPIGARSPAGGMQHGH